MQQLCPVVVGRLAELNVLQEGLEATAAGHGRCVLLVGEPGIGKSRLARELAASAAESGLRVAVGRAVPPSGTAAYRPVTEALLQLLRDQPLPDDPDLAPWLPALQPLLPALPPQPQFASTDVSPAVRGEAVLKVLRRVSQAGSVVILEDLHWADPDTVFLVEYLADNLRQERLMLVLTLRDSSPSAALDMARRHRASPEIIYLDLDRLSADESAEMAHACRPEIPDHVLKRVQEASEGVPLLVEELLVSPGVPRSFAATVTARLAALNDQDRSVVQAAAVLGRHFDWQLLPAVSGTSEDVVAHALAEAVALLLLTIEGNELRFRHALTREAVVDTLLPPQQRQLAATALTALLASRPELDGVGRELAIDLAVRAGDRLRAGVWLIQSGRQALGWGALASAADALRRAAELLAGFPDQADAELGLVRALALAGRVEEAAAAGGRLVTRLGNDPQTLALRAQAHLELARAAVAASRWQMARHQLGSVHQLIVTEPSADIASQVAVLEADVCMADDDYDAALELAERVVRSDGGAAEARCHAFEIIGRTHRSFDLAEGRRAFEQALVTAEAADLPLWRLRALHELGTIDLFDHAGVERLLQARRAAEQMGALSTAAVLDLQLSAGFTCRWDLDACEAHARSAVEAAERLGLDQVRAKALAMLAGSASMRANLAETERYSDLSIGAAPADQMLQGLCLGARGVALLLAGDLDTCIEPYARGIAILGRLPHAEPAALRALWPLVLVATGARRASSAIDEARRLGVAAFNLNRGLIGYAEAILAGRRGDARRAGELLGLANGGFSNCGAWRDLARLLAAPAAMSGAWADGATWLSEASHRFAHRGLPALQAQCEELLRATSPNPWSGAGISAREADVLRLVAEGRPNKEIASRLHLSPRTVEKHVESLLRKTGSRSRTELVARLLPPASKAGHSAEAT